MPQPLRKIVFEIFEIMFQKYLLYIKNMRADFVFGFIQSMDGEKDPRNLMKAFHILYCVVNLIPEFVRFEEDLFEV